jgi:hypothetical protein
VFLRLSYFAKPSKQFEKGLLSAAGLLWKAVVKHSKLGSIAGLQKLDPCKEYKSMMKKHH